MHRAPRAASGCSEVKPEIVFSIDCSVLSVPSRFNYALTDFGCGFAALGLFPAFPPPLCRLCSCKMPWADWLDARWEFRVDKAGRHRHHFFVISSKNPEINQRSELIVANFRMNNDVQILICRHRVGISTEGI
jgi:hypothetical protein